MEIYISVYVATLLLSSMFRVKNEQLQIQVSIHLYICHVNNIFRTRYLSPMYCVNLAETSHTHGSIINVCLKNSIIYDITVCSCINNNFFPI